MKIPPASELIEAWRQWRQPREFRINPAALPAGWQAVLEQICLQLTTPPVQALTEAAPPADQRQHQRFLADLATALWRLRLRMLEPGSNKPKEQFRREYPRLESAWDLLADAGVRVIDHTGMFYDPGQVLEVAARIPTEGIDRERVQETIKPTIYIGDRHVQVGVVLVESPTSG